MVKEFVAGYVAAGTGVVIGHPLDTIKTRLQTSSAYHGLRDAFVQIIRQESILGLYKGMWTPLLTTGFINSLLFSGYGAALRIMHPEDFNIENRSNIPMHEIVIASTAGTMLQLVPAIPMELIKTRLQVQRESAVGIFHRQSAPNSKAAYEGPRDLIAKVLRIEGLRGLYKLNDNNARPSLCSIKRDLAREVGGGVMILRDNIGFLFYLPTYEFLKRRMQKANWNETSSQIIAGGTAGAAGWMSICPLEVVKNRLQCAQSTVPMSAMNAARAVWEEGGVKAFGRGCLVMGLRAFPVNAAVFVIYERILQVLNRVL